VIFLICEKNCALIFLDNFLEFWSKTRKITNSEPAEQREAVSKDHARHSFAACFGCVLEKNAIDELGV
jgi:hypothetical protein